MMTYEKPEVVVLGNAAVLIKGNAKGAADQGPTDFTLSTADCELVD